MVLGTYKKTCKELIFGIQGFDVSTCEVVEEAGYLYIKLKFGRIAEKAIRFGIKLIEMSCSKEKLKVVFAQILEAKGNPIETIMVLTAVHP